MTTVAKLETPQLKREDQSESDVIKLESDEEATPSKRQNCGPQNGTHAEVKTEDTRLDSSNPGKL